MNQTDAELLVSVREGDEQARDILARRHVAWTVDYARRCGAGDLAEDCAQTVLGNLFARPPTVLPSNSARPYLAICIEREVVRALARHTPRPHVPMSEHRTSPSVAVARKQLFGQAMEAMADLPSHQRRLVTMRYVDGLEPTEIAAVTGEPAGSVRKLLSRGLAALRDHRFFSP